MEFSDISLVFLGLALFSAGMLCWGLCSRTMPVSTHHAHHRDHAPIFWVMALVWIVTTIFCLTVALSGWI